MLSKVASVLRGPSERNRAELRRPVHNRRRTDPSSGSSISPVSGPFQEQVQQQYTPLTPGVDELPVYVGREDETRSQHTYTLTHKDQPWLILTFRSSAGASTARPVFFDGALIDGTVEIVLTRPVTVNVQSVGIELEGYTRIASHEAMRFLELSVDLWSSEALPDPSTQKLWAGWHVWPFSFSLPHTVNLTQEGEGGSRDGDTHEAQCYPLPPSYAGNGFPAVLGYNLRVVVRHGGRQKDTYLTIPITYVPRCRPTPPSRLRQMAYADGSDLLGPEADPAGWMSLMKTIGSSCFSAQDARIDCTLSLATPLVYARGTSIPFMVTLETHDVKTFGEFLSSSAITAKLEQMQTVGKRGMAMGRSETASIHYRDNVIKVVSFSSPMRPKYLQDGTCQRFEGEIFLPRDLKPSFSFDQLALHYAVIVTINLGASHRHDQAVTFTQEVAIVTDRPRGPRQSIITLRQ